MKARLTTLLGIAGLLAALGSQSITIARPLSLPTDPWKLGGNAGTIGSDYIGTSDNHLLQFRVNDERALVIYPGSTPSLIGGSGGNTLTSGVIAGTIGGGGSLANPNRVTDNFGTVGGGYNNQAGDNFGAPNDRLGATVSGGYGNKASGGDSTVGGGFYNIASDTVSTVGGGQQNEASDGGATVSGGIGNTASGNGSFVGGGYDNVASGYRGAVGGGGSNTSSGGNSTVPGGYSNEATASQATVGGGGNNAANATNATVGGGLHNTASGVQATIGGGGGNQATGKYATIAGGGQYNLDSPNDPKAANRATDDYATIGGGSGNLAGDAAGTTANHVYATVGGGRENSASFSYATIPGGRSNTASANYATVGGGQNNTASANYATVSGGQNNTASASNSFAAGTQAKANDTGAFVWADSKAFDFESTVSNQFRARATGGVQFVSGIDANGVATAGVKLAAGGGSWSTLSDRNAKTNIAAVDVRGILGKLTAIPVQSWSYKTQDTAIRHIGPMAQDFAKAFGMGEDNVTINTVDADGVALAAIQGLYQVVQEKDAELAALREQHQTVETRLAALEQGRLAAPAAMLDATSLSRSWMAVALVLGGLNLLLLAALIVPAMRRKRVAA